MFSWTILIDGGNVSSGKIVSDYIQSRGIDKIDYMIGTHADADHIGGLGYVLENFEVKNIYRPFQIAGIGSNSDSFVPHENEDLAEVYNVIVSEEGNRNKVSRITTNIYKNFIDSIYSETYTENNITNQSKVTVFYDGLKIYGQDYELEFYAPLVRDKVYDLSNYSDTYGFATMGYGTTNSNGNSAIFSITIFDETFFFTGDASFSSSSENEIPTSGYAEQDFINSLTIEEKQKLSNVSVYLMGHHGSAYSSSEMLMSLITPKFVVVSVGENNTYDHPSENAIESAKKYKSESDPILSTAVFGNIVFGESDENLKYVLSKASEANSIRISWYLLGSIIFIFIETFVIFIKPIKKQKIKTN